MKHILRKTFKWTISGFVLAFFLLSLTQPGMAQDEGSNDSGALGLPVVGPVVEPHNFPLWYEDTEGLTLELCLDDNQFCLIDPPDAEFRQDLDTFDPPLDPVFGEAFWWLAEAEGEVPFDVNGETEELEMLLVLALEATWFGDELDDHVIADGMQNVFGRVRARVDVTEPGIYTVTHPFGVITRTISQEEFDEEADEDTGIYGRGINFTEDLGCVEAPCDFEATLGNITNIGPFLLAADAEGGNLLDFILVDGNLYIADPAEENFVTGSPTGNNFFRVDGPSGVLFETNLFHLMGKLFSVPLVDPDTQLVTFFRDDLGDGAVDFQIPAPLGALTAHAEGVEEVLPGQPIELTLADGVFTGSVLISAANPLPSQVEVTFNQDLGSETTQMFPLTDRIIGFTEEGVADQLADPAIIRRTIRAASSNQWNQNQPDGSLMPTLVVTDPDGVELGEIPGAGGTLDIPSPRPDTVTITSVAADGALDPAGGFVILEVPGVPIPGIYPIILDDDEEE